MIQATAKGKVPAGTETEEWRVMSAAIAFALWSAPARMDQPIETDEPSFSWSEVAPEYRARIRLTLRQALSDGVEFVSGRREAPFGRMPQEWWEKTARLSWLIWLRKRRQTSPVDPTLELIIWNGEADLYRKYVRGVIMSLREQGIHLRLNEL